MKTISQRALIALLLIAMQWGFSAAPRLRADDAGVYTDPAQADEDFPFQGEYRGYQRPQSSHRSSESIGLQVIALGKGKFAAVKYMGGLPGEGWYGGTRLFLDGERTGDVVRLAGDRFDIELMNGVGQLYAKDGRKAGVLERVQRISPTMGARPPRGAIVLFDGSHTDHFRNAKVTSDGWLEAGTETIGAYANFRMHAEFYLPYKPLARGQNRGNSGLYLQSRYEVQILDSFGLEGIENECGSLYRTRRPEINMCLPPLQWQTYDIDFTAARFDSSGNKIGDMVIAVWQNGVSVQSYVAIPNKTGAGQPEAPFPLVTKIQDHGNPVYFRNLWLIDKDDPAAAGQAWLNLPVKAAPVPIQSYSAPIRLELVPAGTAVRFGLCP